MTQSTQGIRKTGDFARQDPCLLVSQVEERPSHWARPPKLKAEADQNDGGHFGCRQGDHVRHRLPEAEDLH